MMAASDQLFHEKRIRKNNTDSNDDTNAAVDAPPSYRVKPVFYMGPFNWDVQVLETIDDDQVCFMLTKISL